MDKVNFNKFKSSNPNSNLPDGTNPLEEPNTETIWNYGPGKPKVECLQNYAIFNNVQNYALANGYEITYEGKDRKQYFGTELYSAFINSKANKRDNDVIDEEELKKFLELKAKEAENPEKTELLNSFIVKRAKDINVIDNSTAGLGFNDKAKGNVDVNNFYVKINKGTKVQLKKVLKSKGLEIPDDDYSAYVIMNLLSTKYANDDKNIREISEAEIDRFVKDIKTNKTLSVKRAGVTDALYNLANGKTINLSITNPESNVDLILHDAIIAEKKLEDAINKDAQEDIDYLQVRIKESEDKIKNSNKTMNDFENKSLVGTKDEFRQKFDAYMQAKSSDDVKKKSALRKEVLSLIKEKKQDEFKFYEDAAKDNKKAGEKLTKVSVELENLKKAIEEDKIIIKEKKAIVDRIIENKGINSFQQLKFLYDEPLILNRVNPRTNKNVSVNYAANDKTKTELYKKLTYTNSLDGKMKIYDRLASNKVSAMTGLSFSIEGIKTGEVIKNPDGTMSDVYQPQFVVKENKNLINSEIQTFTKEDFEFGVELVNGKELKIIQTPADKIAPKLDWTYYKN